MVDSKRRFDTVWWVYVLLLRTSALHKHRFHTIPKTTLSIGIKFFCLFQRLMSLQHRIWVHRMAPSSAIPWFQYIYMMYVLPFSRQTNISNHFDIYIYVYVYIYIHIYIYMSLYIYIQTQRFFYHHPMMSPWCAHEIPLFNGQMWSLQDPKCADSGPMVWVATSGR
jgi:hypothetical protein